MAPAVVVNVESNSPPPTPPPPIAAAFLVIFDHRKGYLLTWHHTLPSLDISGVVEFKSLPSGLHKIPEDLVYFVHDTYAGISAYINQPDAEAERNASMLAVGVLVPLEHGRMGKSWLHADALKELARKQIRHVSDTKELEKYWEEHKLSALPQSALAEESTDSLPGAQANGYQKFRSMSTGWVSVPANHMLGLHHPATTILEFLSTFGPLIFPLYRAALLRKRILLVTETPVELACNLVYNLSVLSALPRQVEESLPSSTSRRRIRPLFNVGIQDIPLLSRPAPQGWIACTTDDLLVTKPELFDLAVFLPGAESKNAEKRVYPRLVPSSPELAKQFPRVGIRATQRDAARYETLASALKQFPRSEVEPRPGLEGESLRMDAKDDAASTLSEELEIQERREVVEPASWGQVAYTSLLWWASAGDRSKALEEEEEEEVERGAMLLDVEEGEEEGRTREVVVVAYFRRLTRMLFQAVGDVLRQEGAGQEVAVEEDQEENREEAEEQDEGEVDGDEQQTLLPHSHSEQEDNDDDDEEEEDIVEITPEDISAMGLDVWSPSDRDFVVELLQVYWARKAKVRGGRVECCGVRIL